MVVCEKGTPARYLVGIGPLGLILGVVGGLILSQPDLSAALTIFVLGGMLFFWRVVISNRYSSWL